jgi:hypothetical protein
MYFSCELQIPITAFEIENKVRIEEIFKLTGFKIDQIVEYGWTMGILAKGDVYGVIAGGNPLELLRLGIALVSVTDFEIEIGSDEEFEKEGAGSLLFSQKEFNGVRI